MDAPQSLEVEAKLLVLAESPDAFTAELRTREHFAGLDATEFVERLLHDRYFDRAESPLAARSCSVRTREWSEGGEVRTRLTFKGPARVSEDSTLVRPEVEGPWSPETWKSIRQQLATLGVPAAKSIDVAQGTAREALEALGLAVVHERQTRRWACDLKRGAQSVAELVFDHVLYDLGDLQVEHDELEIEAMAPAGADEVRRIAQAFLAEHPGELRAWPWSKTALGRALEALHGADELRPKLVRGRLTAAGYESIAARLA